MKYHIITYGCQMNKNDSERIATVLEKAGMKKAEDKNSADLIIINSCSVRQTAEDRVFGEVHNLKSKIQKPFIALTGCMVGRDKDDKIKKKLKGVDLFFTINELPQFKKKFISLLGNRGKEVGVSGNQKQISDFPASSSCLTDNQMTCYRNRDCHYLSIIPRNKSSTSRYLTIQTGCDEFCSYCVVPYARGREYNRPLKEILGEAKKIIDEGASEITLLGQIINKWVAPDQKYFSSKNPFRNHFAALLWELNQIPQLTRLHFTSSHPKYVSSEIIKALNLSKMANYFHLPVQSGDDEILRKMNRKYTAADYLKIIEEIRKARPGIEIGTDIIVGFPGETEEQFQNTVKLCKKVKFNVAYIAMYSPRSGTAAYKYFPDDVPREVKKRRWLILDKLINQGRMGKVIKN